MYSHVYMHISIYVYIFQDGMKCLIYIHGDVSKNPYPLSNTEYIPCALAPLTGRSSIQTGADSEKEFGGHALQSEGSYRDYGLSWSPLTPN